MPRIGKYSEDLIDHEFCSYCGRKMVEKEHSLVGNIYRVDWRCPKWGSFWNTLIGNYSHDLYFLPDRKALPNYDIKNGTPIKWDKAYQKKVEKGEA